MDLTMDEVGTAVIAISLVLIAVFVKGIMTLALRTMSRAILTTVAVRCSLSIGYFVARPVPCVGCANIASN